MSIRGLGNIAVGYSSAMDTVAQQFKDPSVIQDPGKLAEVNIQFMLASQGFQMTSQATHTMYQEDKTAMDQLMRD